MEKTDPSPIENDEALAGAAKHRNKTIARLVEEGIVLPATKRFCEKSSARLVEKREALPTNSQIVDSTGLDIPAYTAPPSNSRKYPNLPELIPRKQSTDDENDDSSFLLTDDDNNDDSSFGSYDYLPSGIGLPAVFGMESLIANPLETSGVVSTASLPEVSSHVGQPCNDETTALKVVTPAPLEASLSNLKGRTICLNLQSIEEFVIIL